MQFLIIGRVSEIFNLLRAIHFSPYSVFNIFLTINSSISFDPAAKKNLHLKFSKQSLINSINFSGSTLFVGPDPPTPNNIFFSLSLILYFTLASSTFCELTDMIGLLSTSIFNVLFKNILAVSIIF